MNMSPENTNYPITVSDKKRLKQQMKLYGAYLSHYGFKKVRIDPMKVDSNYDTLRIIVDSYREKYKLKAALNDLNSWARVGLIVTKVHGLATYVQVHRDTVESLEYESVDNLSLNKYTIDITLGLKEGLPCSISLAIVHNILVLSGPRMGKTNTLRVMLSRLLDTYPDINVTIFTRREDEYQDMADNVEFKTTAEVLCYLEETAKYIDLKHLNVDVCNDRRVIIVDELYDFFSDTYSQTQWNRIYAFLIKVITYGGSAGVYWLASTSVFHNDLINDRFLNCFNTKIFLRLPYLSEACRMGCENAYYLSSSTGDALLIDDSGEARIHIPYKPFKNI